MKRSQLYPLPQFFDRYINLCDDIEMCEAIQKSIDEINVELIEKWKKLGDKVYAQGKWTVKDILQHLIDTERIFCYRALAFARNETQTMPTFDEDSYALSAQANERSLESLIEELKIAHSATKALFESFTPEMLNKLCIGFKGTYSVGSVGFILPGHQRWHFKILDERYYALL